MANLAGPIDIEDYVRHKKEVLYDDRRESRIRRSIEATLQYFNQRSLDPFDDSRTVTPGLEDRKNVSHFSKYSDFTSNNMAFPPSSPRGPVPVGLPQYNPNGLGRDLTGRTIANEKGAQYATYDLDADKKIDLEKSYEANGHGGQHHDNHDHHDVDKEKYEANVPQPQGLKKRLKHFTFAWYAWTMATGGVAFTLSVIPFRFEGLTGLGTAMFIFNIIFFLFNTIAISARFMMFPGTLKHAFSNPHEGFFSATFLLTVATMITNTTAYGIPNSGPWLIDALRIAFWVYLIVTSVFAVVYYHVLFTVKALVITNVLPGWILPIFPAMLVGTLASAIAKTQPPAHAFPMLVAGLSYQGLGMMLALMMYPIYFGRLMTSGLPADQSRPAMFIAVGPPAFTALALIGMAQDMIEAKIVPDFISLPGIQNKAMITDQLQILALLAAIGLWVFAAWCFGIAIFAMFEGIHRNDFHLNWYAKVFPNVGFTIATIQIGTRLDSTPIQMVGTGMASILFFAWLIVFFCHIKAIKNRMIAWPGKDEDAH
jgi:C4-dicarboxylate transporter/malic acid transport protein